MPGGGTALIRAVDDREFAETFYHVKIDDEAIGFRIVKRACEEPLRPHRR